MPLATFVRKYTNMRFEPAGITDDPELRIASSLVDYIFRRLALDYLSSDERIELGILSTPGAQPADPARRRGDGDAHRSGWSTTSSSPGAAAGRPGAGAARRRQLARADQLDAPLCYNCGNTMQRAGRATSAGAAGRRAVARN